MQLNKLDPRRWGHRQAGVGVGEGDQSAHDCGHPAHCPLPLCCHVTWLSPDRRHMSSLSFGWCCCLSPPREDFCSQCLEHCVSQTQCLVNAYRLNEFNEWQFWIDVLDWLIRSSLCLSSAFQVWCKILEAHTMSLCLLFISCFSSLPWKAQTLRCAPVADLTRWTHVSWLLLENFFGTRMT